MEITQHLPALIVVVPLLGGLLTAGAGWVNRRWAFPFAAMTLLVATGAAIAMLLQVLGGRILTYQMAGWAPPVGINYRIDHLSSIVLAMISGVAFLNLIASRVQVEADFGEKAPAWYALYILFMAGLSGMVATADAFNLYVLLEIASLTGYALIGLGSERAAISALNYLFMGTIGASLYLLGVGYLYIATGTLNMGDLVTMIPASANQPVIQMAFVLCLTGLLAKMALFPFHGWLPNAYSNAPNATAGIIAPLTTKVTVYVMARVMLYVFPVSVSFGAGTISSALVWIASIAIVAGALMALSQRKLKLMLTYIIVAEVGYMVGGFWLGNRTAMTGAILHIINDAAMTLCVFLAAANITRKLGSDAFQDLKGLFRKMPFSMAGFVVGAMAIIGIPPTCGFFSKWYLISGGIEAGHYGFVAALLFSSIINAVLFFRIFEICHFEPFQDAHGHDDGDTHHHGPPPETMAEAPISMVVPLLISALALIVLGLYAGDIVTNFIQYAIPAQVA